MFYLKLFMFSLIVNMCYSKLHDSDIFAQPPHCTRVTKESDYAYRFKFDYPVGYIHPGQREVYQKLYCLHPQAVNKAVTYVCDWAAPPQVEFTLGDEYVHVLRQDPNGRYLGDAVIKTDQYCAHKNYTSKLDTYVNVTELFL